MSEQLRADLRDHLRTCPVCSVDLRRGRHGRRRRLPCGVRRPDPSVRSLQDREFHHSIALLGGVQPFLVGGALKALLAAGLLPGA